MIVKKLRLQRGWSQEHLSELTGLSTRTIQRIEQGQMPSLESLKALSKVLDTDIATLQKGLTTDENEVVDSKDMIIASVKNTKAFYSHLIKYIIVITILFIFNLIQSPSYMWVYWVIFGWGIGLAIHALNVFGIFRLFDPDWEKKQIDKRLDRRV